MGHQPPQRRRRIGEVHEHAAADDRIEDTQILGQLAGEVRVQECRVAPLVLGARLIEEGHVAVEADESSAHADALEDKPREMTRTAADVQHACARRQPGVAKPTEGESLPFLVGHRALSL